MNDDEWQVYREIYQVIEWKDGAVYKTKYLRDDWVPYGSHADMKKGLVYAVITDETKPTYLPRRKPLES